MAKAEAVELEISGRTVRITSPDKLFFPERGETKLDLVEYYLAIEEPFLRAVGGRPTLLQRFPDGVGAKSFFQKRVPQGAPGWLRTTTMSTPNGTTSNAMVLEDLAHVAWAVNMGCLGFHPWPCRADHPGTTDELRIDLDPSPGIGFDEEKPIFDALFQGKDTFTFPLAFDTNCTLSTNSFALLVQLHCRSMSC